MTEQTTLDLNSSESDDGIALGHYAQRAYLEYALSVVKGRALPDVCDGQKPVQRRILYSMDRMGLSYSGPNNNTAAKPVKSARVVGDVLGRYHPHGDTAAYDALVGELGEDRWGEVKRRWRQVGGTQAWGRWRKGGRGEQQAGRDAREAMPAHVGAARVTASTLGGDTFAHQCSRGRC